tara:strand:+ start:61 stop:387 length:327 start_codon:yes stop_codon:yes gene_type:complete
MKNLKSLSKGYNSKAPFNNDEGRLIEPTKPDYKFTPIFKEEILPFKPSPNINSITKGYKGGSKNSSVPQLIPSPKPTIVLKKEINTPILINKIDVNRKINSLNNGYKK